MNVEDIINKSRTIIITKFRKQFILYRVDEKELFDRLLSNELKDLKANILRCLSNVKHGDELSVIDNKEKNDIINTIIMIINITYIDKVSLEQIRSISQKRIYINVRHWTYYVLFNYFNWTGKSIALEFNRSDHSHVSSALKKLRDLQYDKQEQKRKAFIDKNIKLYLENKELELDY